ncbi:NADPH dehydrogenase NamA [Alteribacillus sp. YIM 98480]|uniref:NADPH dehydrogenase NamA n=1 Tax=Alteribacillus sp. YIM 98480 TaxID=2606599 RepID=UPI00131ADD6A|nr:NADPH dehydrogenase NamA [Alteribacillus sp. YIM 98480]
MKLKLFSPFKISNITLKNRIVMSPMCQFSSHEKDGKIQDWHLTHYISRAVGQVGLIIVESTAVTPQGRISDKDLGIWSDKHIKGFNKLSRMVHHQGAHIGIQLAHAGRKATVDGDIFSPSAVPFEKMKTPIEMSKKDIKEVIQAFKDGAVRAKKAGFDVIEIHAAHGYLINEFLSPLSNLRQDEYGGTKIKRYRFLKEIIDAVNQVWDGPLFVRISATDYHSEGNSVNDYVEYAKLMKNQGVDLVDCSSGAVLNIKPNVYPGYQVKLAEEVKKRATIMTGAVGLITSGLQAEEILSNDRSDLIFIGRELLRDPYWPRVAADELGTPIDGPNQYDRSWSWKIRYKHLD